MGGHKSKSCTFSEPAATPPPPVPDFIVTGDGVPNPNGNYFADGLYGGEMSYKNESLNFWIWFSIAENSWFVSEERGDTVNSAAWIKDLMPLERTGEYRDYNFSSGNLTVTTT